VVAVGEVQRGQQRGVEPFVRIALEPVHHLLPLDPEVHGDEPLVDLDDAVLKPGRDGELLLLDGEDEGGLGGERDGDVVELHQAAQGGHDDRAGSGQADLPRDRGLVADREVAARGA
jgi:hypothetical protein